jgi:hypothetical protein
MISAENYSTKPFSREHQLLVLGRGKQLNGNKPNRLTRERGRAIGYYCMEYSPLLVVSSGRNSSQSQGASSPVSTEAVDLEENALEVFPSLKAVVHTRRDKLSRTTGENMVYSKKLLIPGVDVGILAHAAQLPRALYLADKVLDAEVFGVPAEMFGAKPEIRLSEAVEARLLNREMRLLGDVEPGDFDEAARRILGQETSATPRPVKMIAGVFLPQYN